MEIKQNSLKRKYFASAIDFAITGMHFERYTQNRFLLKLYGRYFLYMEMERATQILTACEGDRLAGILMAVIEGEPKCCHSLWRSLYVKVVRFIMNHLMSGASSSYDEANRRMLAEYKKRAYTDGEICFLAADPNAQGRGIGSRLLAELERIESGKKVYLFTDNNCTWQFYEHRGFERVGEKEIEMDIAGHDVPLTCLLYAKEMKRAQMTRSVISSDGTDDVPSPGRHYNNCRS